MKPNFKSRTVYLRDNIDILRSMNSECVDLIYLDPPFNKKKQFTAPIGSAAEGASFLDLFGEEDIKGEWVEEFRQENYELHSFLNGVKGMRNAYNYCYLVYMAVRIVECHRILKKTGSLYLHCDPTMNWGLRAVLDCIFGDNNFRNDIVWKYGLGGSSKRMYSRKHDIIFFYTKSAKYHFEKPLMESTSGMMRGKKKGLIDVWDIPAINNMAKERTGWPTQKPLALLKRIVKASSKSGDLVLDPFCGCVTTCIAAELLEREWVGIDVAKEAWNQIERRLREEVPANLFRGKAVLTTKLPVRGRDDVRPKKYVYVISNPAYRGMYKVGVAGNAEALLNQCQTADPKRRYKLEFKKLTPEYKTLEPYIHRKFDGDYEWVTGELEDIVNATKNYHPS